MITITLPDWLGWFIVICCALQIALDLWRLVLHVRLRREERRREILTETLERARARDRGRVGI